MLINFYKYKKVNRWFTFFPDFVIVSPKNLRQRV